MSERAGDDVTAEEPNWNRWLKVDIEFKFDVDYAALFAAIEPPQDVLDGRSLADIRRNEDTLESRLRAWGWGTDRGIACIGVYYDYTTKEDDERFMPLIAPFVQSGSIAVYEPRNGYGKFGWEFDGEGVKHGEAEADTTWWIS